MSKNQERRKKFLRLQQAVSANKIGDPDAPDYHTGKESAFLMKRYDRHLPIPFGPKFKTPQWERMVKIK
jgi:hypothetical protein